MYTSVVNSDTSGRGAAFPDSAQLSINSSTSLSIESNSASVISWSVVALALNIFKQSLFALKSSCSPSAL